MAPDQVKLGISHHSLNDARDDLKSEKSLVFVCEPPKDDDDEGVSKKKRKKSKQGITMNGFGGRPSISKFKGNTNFVIGYRCRPVSFAKIGCDFT